MIEFVLLKNFLIALALGALIGLEREYSQAKGRYTSFAGIRTFPLISLSGAIFTYFGKLVSPWVLVSGVIVFCGLIVAAYYTTSKDSKHHGITTAIAAFIAFFVGILCLLDQTILAAVIAITTTILLYARNFLHKFAKRIKKKELADTLKFVVIAFVILPFLPNQSYGPYGIFNPFLVWLIIVFISGISFVGYILTKWFGERGITLTGIFGGLVSSIAVTTSFADRSKKETKVIRTLASGVMLANATMFFRVLVIIFTLNRNLLIETLPPIGILILISIASAYFLLRKEKKTKKPKLKLSSPFTLGPALKFGFIFAVIFALVKITDIYFSSRGVYLISLISGFADVDAITISLLQLAKKNLTENIVKNGIILAILANTATKGGIAYLFGSKQFGKMVLISFSIIILIGLGTIFLL